jgi:hypothetical protein
MTGLTGRCEPVATVRCLPVEALVILILDVVVTATALHRPELLGVGVFTGLNLVVTVDTFQPSVGRSEQGSRVETRRLAGDPPPRSADLMTHRALFGAGREFLFCLEHGCDDERAEDGG